MKQSDFEEEIRLPGGEINDVVRVGETVRRASHPWTPTIHALLKHLEEAGFEGSPRARGYDNQGREIITFIEGTVPSGPNAPPSFVWSDLALVATAKLLRKFHDATTTFRPACDARWCWSPAPASRDDLVVCHNDPAWWNTVFIDGQPIALIDWDLAAPGPRSSDIAYVLWYWVPVRADDVCAQSGLSTSIETRGRRIRLFCDAYGVSDRSQVVDWIERKQAEVADEVTRLADDGVAGYQELVRRGGVESVRQDQRFLALVKPELANALSFKGPR